MNNKVLIVDDETNILSTLKSVLSGEPYDVICAGSGDEALEIMEKEEIDILISDEKMPGMSGTELLEIARRKYPDTLRIILTGYASLDAAIKAYETSIKHDETHADAWQNLSGVYAKVGNVERSQQCFKMALKYEKNGKQEA